MSFSPGDTVRLKSGGPLMTVEELGEDFSGRETVFCVWSDKEGSKQIVQRDGFPPIVLEASQKPSFGAVRTTRS